MKEVFIVSENEEIFTQFSRALSFMPVHFSWVGDMDSAEKQFRTEKPDFIFFAVRKLTLLHNWIARYKSFKMKIPYICFISKIDWEKRELLWMAGAAEVIEMPKLKKEFIQIVESVLIEKDDGLKKGSLSGDLSVFNVIDLIKTFDDGKKNGVIKIISRNRKGSLSFNKGKLVNAIYNDKDPLEAVITMSAWKEGAFSVNHDNLRHSQFLRLENEQIIKECQDHIIAYEKQLTKLPDNNITLYSSPLLDYEEIGPVARNILLFFKNGKTLADFFDQDADGSLQTVDQLLKWIHKRSLVERKEFREQQAILKDHESSSSVKKLMNKMFSKKSAKEKYLESQKEKTAVSPEEEIAEKESRIPHLFSNYDELKILSLKLEQVK